MIMKIVIVNLLLSFAVFTLACGSQGSANAVNRPAVVVATPTATPIPKPENRDYLGKGKVTKINNELGSVELNHHDIPGLMPPMIMEFFVSDKAMLKGVLVGDIADFTLRYNDGQETIVKLRKAK